MLSAVLSGFLLALVAPWVIRAAGRWGGWILAILPLLLTAYFARLLPEVAAGGAILESQSWVPALGVALSFRLDGLSLLFALLITGIGTLIVVYAGGYLQGHPHQGRFFSFLLMFMGAMLGLVLADNLIALFVFWELTSVTSYLLIGFDHRREAARRAALQALIVTGGGGLAMLAGFLLLGAAGGSLELSDLLTRRETLAAHPWYGAILLLVLAGAFSKSAQVPLHFWLPNAMEAPTPVSAYLHSATMVKAGVYLLARLQPPLGGSAGWTVLLTLFGAATLVTGAVLAVRQSDLKLILAYTTVASLGALVMLLGIDHETAFQAAVLYLLAHSLFKGALFMVAGALDHEAKSRDVLRLGGLARAMPVTAAAATLAALSMVGLPPFLGFLGKELLYEGALAGGAAGWLTAAALIGNALMLVAAGLVALKPFYGAGDTPPGGVHEAPPALWLGPVLLALLGLAGGLLLGPLGSAVVAPAATAIAGRPIGAELQLWHGITPALLLSGGTLLLGGLMLWQWRRLQAATAWLLRTVGWGPDRGYDQALAGLELLSVALTRRLQTGLLRHYMLATFAATALALLWAMATGAALPTRLAWPEARWLEWAAALLTLAGGVATLTSKSRLAAVAAVGVVGYGVALLFLLFGAPDLAFTQFMVETLVVVVIALVLIRLSPNRPPTRTRRAKLRDGTVAAATAGLVTLTLLAVTEGELDLSLSAFFAAESVPTGHGRNIVNVILVDFRALDTLGEITVVMVAALAAIALITLRARRPR